MDVRRENQHWSMSSLVLTMLVAMSLVVGSARGQAPREEFVFVPAADEQPGGPTHDFRISRFETRNDQFVAFLNDARANTDNERGEYLLFVTTTGDVHIHTVALGAIEEEGTGPLIFEAAGNPHVSYDEELEVYQVEAGFEAHPVTGVTWFGALKYCNWLTIDVGLPASERAYTESHANDLDGWHPITITKADWQARDLDTSERTALLSKLGFRLPMDGGDGAGSPSEFNEWFKAAAWDSSASVDRAFGFGRDTIINRDANYRCSGDPFEDAECLVGGTTPVGYYDGSDHGGAFSTSVNENSYGVFDLSGNVWEWMQDKAFDQDLRSNRGGSFRSSSGTLAVVNRAERLPDSATDSTGFRVVQSVTDSLLVTPAEGLINSGIWGGPYDEDALEKTWRVTNVTDAPVTFAIAVDAQWVTLLVVDEGGLPVGDVLAGGETIFVTATITPECNGDLEPGTNTATIIVDNLDDGASVERTVQLSVTEPLKITPTNVFNATMQFGEESPSRSYTINNTSDRPVTWSVEWEDTSEDTSEDSPVAQWLLLDGVPIDDIVARTISRLSEIMVEVSFDVSSLTAGDYSAVLTIIDDCTGAEHARSITLTIDPLFTVSPTDQVLSTGVGGGPFVPAFHEFELTNATDEALDWRASIDPPETDWLSLDSSSGTLTIDEPSVVVVRITSAADALAVGNYEATVRLRDEATGFVVERVVELEVTELSLSPVGDIEFEGPRAGPFSPSSRVLTLSNTGFAEMTWTAVFDDTSDPTANAEWLTISPASGIILEPNGVALIDVELAAGASTLPTGVYTGVITVTSTETGASAERNVTFNVGQEAFSLSTALVPADHFQPGGPDYLFRIQRFEVTNEQFVRFLNDSLQDGNGPIGAFVTHDTTSGTARLSGDSTLLFDAGVREAIAFENDAYVSLSGEESKPVVGVSWHGALKFCNWMTRVQLMTDPDQRAYHEGPTASDWYPITADPLFYGTDGLTQLQRRQLVDEVRGFRLPMDDRSGAASLFNEWYKAAAWLNSSRTHSVYGFGRDVLENVDANFFNSSDEFEPGPAPVGYFNGSNTLADDSIVTVNTENTYGVHDMTGNVAEWMQDLGTLPSTRSVRGGHFDTPIGSQLLRADTTSALPSDTPQAFVGFRVVQAFVPEPLILSMDPVRIEGVLGGPYTSDAYMLSVLNTGEHTLDSMILGVNVSWLTSNVLASRLVPPSGETTIPIDITASAQNPGVSPTPLTSMSLVPKEDVQTGGPEYDFWIGRNEVTNSEFTEFLNDARANAKTLSPDLRSEHIYFDLDSGSVYVNDEMAGAEGTDAPTETINTLLYDASMGRITFVNDSYVATSGFANHPVVGVSWYGAVKYCNWLTVNDGLPASLAAYVEAPSPAVDAWRPVGVDLETWRAGEMPAGARAEFLTATIGYHLPMDESSATASPYNEWFKAAAWNDEGGVTHTYGFGRDSLGAVDANFVVGGALAEDGTTPVGFFNSTSTLFQEVISCLSVQPETTKTSASENAYSLNDLTGNVAEWTQDFGDDAAARGVRGGSWRHPIDAAELTNAARESRAASGTFDDVGFRVVRGTGHVATITANDQLADESYSKSVILDLNKAFVVTPRRSAPLTRDPQPTLFGDDFSNLVATFRIQNTSSGEMDWSSSVDQPWLAVDERDTGEVDGRVDEGGTVTLDVITNEQANDLLPGTHDALVIARNVTTGSVFKRNVSITIESPSMVEALHDEAPHFTGLFTGPITPVGETVGFRLESRVASPFAFSVAADQPWIELEPFGFLDGILQPSDRPVFTVSLTEEADALPVGTHEANIVFTINQEDGGELIEAITHTIEVEIIDPLLVTQPADPWHVGPNLDPDVLPSQMFTINNQLAGVTEMTVCIDKPWLSADAQFLEIPGNQSRALTLSINTVALELFDGQYTATVVFNNELTGSQQSRTVELTIDENIFVTPFAEFVTSGVAGGAVRPPLKLYRLTNGSDERIDWSISVPSLDADWVEINGASSAGGSLDAGMGTNILISVNAQETVGIGEGAHTATVSFEDVTHGVAISRDVTLTLIVPKLTLAQRPVDAASDQPGGPDYTFFMSRIHTTNEEFLTFLNDALANPGNQRGAYVFFDTATGDVYVNVAQAGQSGTQVEPRTALMFSPEVSTQIQFADGTYRLVETGTDYATHPVTGVSWYGSVKYCNWLTLDQGMPVEDRCYTESADPNLNGWRPVAIVDDDWVIRDLDGTERQTLVSDCRGYRLPMDDGYDNANSQSDFADTFNEWYKASAWHEANQRNMTYGFGRDALTGADANYRCSGDPFEDSGDCTIGGTTPGGFYDGGLKSGAFQTNADENSFGLSSMTGNAAHWMQGRYNSNPTSIDFRTVRGGSWNDTVGAASLHADYRTFAPPGMTNARIGFRVVRVPDQPTGDVDADGDVDAQDLAIATLCMQGPQVAASSGCAGVDFNFDGSVDLSDFAVLQNIFGVDP